LTLRDQLLRLFFEVWDKAVFFVWLDDKEWIMCLAYY